MTAWVTPKISRVKAILEINLLSIKYSHPVGLKHMLHGPAEDSSGSQLGFIVTVQCGCCVSHSFSTA